MRCEIETEERSHVEVRAVFINCELDDKKVSDDSENARFQREELFKHNNLRNCKKKLALTVKMTSEPDKSSGDEFIPIEHVFDGSKKRRVRLLDPFVLRLRREEPLQAYKIRRIDTVSGIFSDSIEQIPRQKSQNTRTQHGSEALPQKAEEYASLTKSEKRPKEISHELYKTDYNSLWKNYDSNLLPVQNREQRNIFNRKYNQDKKNQRENQGIHDKQKRIENDDLPTLDEQKYGYLEKYNINNKYRLGLYDTYKVKTLHDHRIVSKDNYFELDDETTTENLNSRNPEKHYAVYEIGNPDLWYTVHIQLYEKLTTQEGKTVWNDITKEEVASVSTLNPEWNNSDMSVQYRPAEWLSHEEFSLPKASLCLLIPIRGTDLTNLGNDGDSVIDNFGEFLVLSIDEIISEESSKKRRDKTSIFPTSNTSIENKSPRRVLIRASRAVMGGSAENLIFASKGSEQYMMIPHRHPHHSQLDVESRADGNQLIHVGSFGRLMTAVSDNTRRTRTVLTLQVTNTGLAAARFRVAARDCGPGLLKQMNTEGSQGLITGPALLSPKHTHRFLLEVPFDIPDDYIHCYVSILNDDDDSVAVRDVAIKKGDRCFCVWHCNCVCLSDDPKLICHEMSETQQVAAGLSLQERQRHIRSVCYPDNVTMNIVVIVIGVLAALLTLGFIKAVLGLAFKCIGSWGLERILKMPRKLDHYFESSLKHRPVIYDNDGWPIHPDTMKRSVQTMSKHTEFILNLIFFTVLPGIMVRDALRSMNANSGNTENCIKSKPTNTKKVYSTQDIQNRYLHLRSGYQSSWIKPSVHMLSDKICRRTLNVQKAIGFNNMRPLLREDCCRKSEDLLSSYVDSEQDDTEYVLMQMQKSRESLARSQRIHTEASSNPNNWKDDFMMPSTSKR